jgi:hypothetical protein
MLPEKDNTAQPNPAIPEDNQPSTSPASAPELPPQQEKELIAKAERLLKEFNERHKDEDDSMDIIQKI